MTDKFEFKPQQNNHLFSAQLNMRKKSTLIEYKQVIMELSEALAEVTNQNQKLKIQMGKFRERDGQRMGLIKEEENKYQGLVQRNQYVEEEMSKLNKYVKEYKAELLKSEEKIKALQTTNRQLQDKINIYQQRMKDYEETNQINNEKIRMLEEALQVAIQQNKHIKSQIYNANQLNEGQLKDLREFHEELRRKFETLEISAPSYTEDNDRTNKHLDYKIQSLGKQKRSFSTQKKSKRNVGCLSSNKNLHRKTTRANPLLHQQSQSIRPFQVSINNPQLSSQLQNLKKQIAQQYTLMSIKNQTYSKQRVSKTLEQLKRRMGKVIQNVQQSQSESCLEY